MHIIFILIIIQHLNYQGYPLKKKKNLPDVYLILEWNPSYDYKSDIMSQSTGIS